MSIRRRWIRMVLAIALGLLFSLSSAGIPSLAQIHGAPSLQQGQWQYQAGQYAAAAEQFQRVAQTAPAGSLLQAQALGFQARAAQHLGDWHGAAALVDDAMEIVRGDRAEPLGTMPSRILAQLYNTRGQLALARGHADLALDAWTLAEQYYGAAAVEQGLLGSRINQVQAMQSLGFYRQAGQLLQSLRTDLQAQPESLLKLRGLLTLGNTLQRSGEVDQAQTVLLDSLAMAERLSQADLSRVRLSLGNGERLLAKRSSAQQSQPIAAEHRQKALALYQLASNAVDLPEVSIQAQQNQLALLLESQKFADAQRLWPELAQTLATLPASRTSTDARVNLAQQLIELRLAGIKTIDGETTVGSKNQSSPLLQAQTRDTSRPRWLNGSRGKFRFVPPKQAISVPETNASQASEMIANEATQTLDSALPLPTIADIETLLSTATYQARQLQDERSQSFAIGTQAGLYEQLKDWPRARILTQKALQQAQRINALDIAYQWQWQLGRILQHQTEALHPGSVSQDAINQYSTAIHTLEHLRSDLVALNPDVQFSFRETVEPVYRELVDLLLREPSQDQPLPEKASIKLTAKETSTPDALKKARLVQARAVLESLQLAELDNFFRDACAQPEAVNIDDLDPHAAVIYPILLPDRLEVVLKLPGKDNLQHYAQPVAAEEVGRVAREMRRALASGLDRRSLRQSSQQLYRWLIEPFEAALEAEQEREPSQIQTLTFVLDGPLRNLPMAALSKTGNDGTHYLMERYAIAITPGLQLLEPHPLPRENLKILLAGTTNSPSFSKEGFAPLDNVESELKGIQALFQTSQLLNQEQFSQANIEANLANGAFEIIHLATHGQFSSNPDQTFVLDWGDRISVNSLDDLLDATQPNRTSPVEMLVLSACETAKGDDRAALGLAGVAIRAGARSTLATLWQVNDASTAEFMVRFYQELSRPELTKAEALRNAQLAMLQGENNFDSPYYWAPFILVGNWL